MIASSDFIIFLLMIYASYVNISNFGEGLKETLLSQKGNRIINITQNNSQESIIVIKNVSNLE